MLGSWCNFVISNVSGASPMPSMVPVEGVWQLRKLNGLRLPTRRKHSIELQKPLGSFPNPALSFPAMRSARKIECGSLFCSWSDSHRGRSSYPNQRAFPSHGRGRRFNPYSAHQRNQIVSLFSFEARPCFAHEIEMGSRPGGRRFKFCHADHFHKQNAEATPTVCAILSRLNLSSAQVIPTQSGHPSDGSRTIIATCRSSLSCQNEQEGTACLNPLRTNLPFKAAAMAYGGGHAYVTP